MASVVDLVSSLAGYLKVRDPAQKPVIDNFIFRLHYHATTIVFFTGCILTTASHLLGAPISCQSSIPGDVINPYCWVTTTFTLVEKKNGQPYDGVGPIGENDEIVKHAYYQWVPFLLFFHGLSFYLPHWIWKYFEGGKIKMISDKMRGISLEETEERKGQKEKVANYLIDTMHMHNEYAWTYFFCEILNMVNLFVSMYVIHIFLGGTFLHYGLKVLKFPFEDPGLRRDPMIQVFPRMTKCSYHNFGVSGTKQTSDALCVLSLNIINEKIYITVWFWLLALAILTVLGLAYNLALLTMPSFRMMVISKRFHLSSRKNVNKLIRKLQVGDFLILHLLGQNLNTITFHKLLFDINDKLHTDSINNGKTLELDPYYPNDKLLSSSLNMKEAA